MGCLGWSNGVRTVIGMKGERVVVIPWNWQTGNKLTAEIDANVPADLRIAMGEGELRHRKDPDDPDSLVDIRWLSSIVGAVVEQRRAALLITTEGILVLSGRTREGEVENRLHYLQMADREALLADHGHNCWIPQQDIVEAKVAKRLLAKVATIKAALRLQTTSGQLRVDLVSERQGALLTRRPPQVLGTRFGRRPTPGPARSASRTRSWDARRPPSSPASRAAGPRRSPGRRHP